MMFRTHKRAFAFAPLLAAIALMTACDDDPVEPPDPADAVDVIRLTIGSDTVDLQQQETETITIPLGASDVTATFLDADGNVVGGLDEFELRLVPNTDDEDIVTWERDASNPFAGTLTGENEGDANDVAVQLFHIPEDHEDLESFLNVIVE